MSTNLVAAGHTVRGFDPVPAAAEAAAEHGVVVLDSGPAAAAGADVVITMLPHGDAVKRCYAEILPVANEGALFIDSSTISVDDAREVHASAASHGLAQLDAPVSGGVKGAVAGTLAFMVGGDADAIAACTLRCWNQWRARSFTAAPPAPVRPPRYATTWCSPCSRSRSARRSCLAEKLGLSAQSLFDVITGATGNCWAVHTNCPVPGPVPTSPANNDFTPGFATALMNKDLGLAMDAVSSTGSSAPLGSHAADIYAKFATTHGDKDFSAIIETLRG